MAQKKSRKRDPIKRSNARPDAVKELGGDVSIKARFWLEKNGSTYLASGRIDLLKQLAKCGSISAAAEAMGISYHHAWSMVDKMNELAKEPLIIATPGGKGGGGTELTEKGTIVLAKFEEIQNVFHELIAEINVSFND